MQLILNHMKNIYKILGTVIVLALFAIPSITQAACARVAVGGTGNCYFTPTLIPFGDGTSPLATSSLFSYITNAFTPNLRLATTTGSYALNIGGILTTLGEAISVGDAGAAYLFNPVTGLSISNFGNAGISVPNTSINLRLLQDPTGNGNGWNIYATGGKNYIEQTLGVATTTGSSALNIGNVATMNGLNVGVGSPGVYFPGTPAPVGISVVNQGDGGNYGNFPSTNLQLAQDTSGSNQGYNIIATGGRSYFERAVGFGSTTPASQVSVTGDIDLTGVIRATGNPGTTGMVLQTTGSAIQWVSTSSLAITGTGNAAFTIGNGVIYNATSTDLVAIGSTTAIATLNVKGKGGTNPFIVASSTGAQLLTLLQNGNFGIGISAPSTRLDVNGTAQAGNFVATSSTATSTFAGGLTAGGATTLVVTNSSVGIGTAAPAQKFDLANGSGGFFRITSGSDVNVSTGSGGGLLSFVANKFGVGTSTPSELFTVSLTSATATALINSNSTSKGACLMMKDADGSGYTFIVVNNGVLTASTNDCR